MEKFEVYVILSHYSDGSGTPQVVGVYFDKDEALKLSDLLKSEAQDKIYTVITQEVV